MTDLDLEFSVEGGSSSDSDDDKVLHLPLFLKVISLETPLDIPLCLYFDMHHSQNSGK